MNIEITYKELGQFIKEQYGKNVAFAQVDERTVKVTTSAKKLFMSLQVSLILKVEEACGSTIRLTHACPTGIDLILKAAMSLIKKRNPAIGEIVSLQGNKTILVNLDEIPRLRGALEKLSLTDITFAPSSTIITLTLK